MLHLTTKEKIIINYITKNLNKNEFMVYEIFSDKLDDDEINGVIGSLTKKGLVTVNIKGIFKLNKIN